MIDYVADPIIVPDGTTTGASVKLIRVKRKMPELRAAHYDGTNAVQLAAWLLAMGRSARVDFQPNRPPLLVNPETNAAIKPGWLLPTLEPIKQSDLGTIWDQAGPVEVVPITNTVPTTPPVVAPPVVAPPVVTPPPVVEPEPEPEPPVVEPEPPVEPAPVPEDPEPAPTPEEPAPPVDEPEVQA